MGLYENILNKSTGKENITYYAGEYKDNSKVYRVRQDGYDDYYIIGKKSEQENTLKDNLKDKIEYLCKNKSILEVNSLLKKMVDSNEFSADFYLYDYISCTVPDGTMELESNEAKQKELSRQLLKEAIDSKLHFDKNLSAKTDSQPYTPFPDKASQFIYAYLQDGNLEGELDERYELMDIAEMFDFIEYYKRGVYNAENMWQHRWAEYGKDFMDFDAYRNMLDKMERHLVDNGSVIYELASSEDKFFRDFICEQLSTGKLIINTEALLQYDEMTQGLLEKLYKDVDIPVITENGEEYFCYKMSAEDIATYNYNQSLKNKTLQEFEIQTTIIVPEYVNKSYAINEINEMCMIENVYLDNICVKDKEEFDYPSYLHIKSAYVDDLYKKGYRDKYLKDDDITVLKIKFNGRQEVRLLNNGTFENAYMSEKEIEESLKNRLKVKMFIDTRTHFDSTEQLIEKYNDLQAQKEEKEVEK